MKHKFTLNSITYDIQKIAKISRNNHRESLIDGEPFCSRCYAVWPCPEYLTALSLLEELEKKDEDS